MLRRCRGKEERLLKKKGSLFSLGFRRIACKKKKKKGPFFFDGNSLNKSQRRAVIVGSLWGAIRE